MVNIRRITCHIIKVNSNWFSLISRKDFLFSIFCRNEISTLSLSLTLTLTITLSLSLYLILTLYLYLYLYLLFSLTCYLCINEEIDQ